MDTRYISRRLLRSVFAAVLLLASPANAQETPLALTVTVVDPTGALIVGAQVHVAGDRADPIDTVTGQYGTARIVLPGPARVSIRVESPGFEPASIADLRVRRETRRTIKLALAKVYESVEVGRDPRERSSDPRSDAFATILGAAEIRELPDDPDEMERILREMAGPGAVMRVNGFRGGRLPPKEQIAQIRFHRNMFAADAHEPGFISVDVITKPGFDNWTGSTGLGLRNDALNARNALAPDKGDEQNTRGSFSISGPLWKKRTSMAVSVNGTHAFDTQTIVGVTPAGPFARSTRRPNDAGNASIRIEHALTPARQLRLEFQQGRTMQDNLGVGNFDLESRAYRQTRDDTVFRGSLAGSLGKGAYNEARASWRSRTIGSTSRVEAPTVTVLNAFTDGGAQVDGQRSSRIFEAADDLDIARGRHAWRTGFLLQAGSYQTAERRNALGTYTFADLAAWSAGRPTTLTRTVGNPDASIAQTEFASYLQDDVRISTRLTISGGVRQEWQSGIGGLHLGPRGGIAWSPFRSGRTTVRGGGGIFFDSFDAEDALRAVQLDGAHQQVETVIEPDYPPDGREADRTLSNGRLRLAPALAQPRLREMNVAIEQSFGAVRLSTMLIHRRGSHELRGIDINAPVQGVRPAPLAGPITEVRSSAQSGFDGVSVNLNVARPERRIFLAANYTLSRAWNETDAPFSLPADAAHAGAERGPAATDARHRAMGFASVPLGHGLAAGLSFNARSALPYDIVTGRDDNGDTLSTDRPAGVTRNTGRGRGTVDVSARLAWRKAFGVAHAAPSGPQVRIIRGGGDSNPLADMPAGDRSKRFAFEAYAQAFNLLNHLNATTFGSVIASPFFGRPVAAAPPRRIELGIRLAF